MLFGPIFTIEVLTSARRVRAFALRTVFALALLLVLWSSYAATFLRHDQTSIATAASFAAAFFNGFIFVQVTAMLLLAPAAVGSLVARERERRTIEYLFATDLSNAEIVLGKLAAGLLNLAGLLLAGLPILALAMLFGGIGPERLVAAYAVSFSTMVCVSCVSLSVSIWTSRSRDAVVQSYLLIVLLLFAPFFLSDLIDLLPASAWWRWLVEQLLACNPYGFQFALLPSAFGGGLSGIWQLLQELLRNQAILAGVCLMIAIAGIRRAHLRSLAVPTKRRGWTMSRFAWRPRLGVRAMLWKELFVGRPRGKLAWFIRLSVGLLLVMYAVQLGVTFFDAVRFDSGSGEYADFVIFAGTALALFSLLLVGVRASQSVATERERDTWLALLSTPMASSEIVFSKLAGSLYAAAIPGGLLIVTWILTCFVYPLFVFALPFALVTLAILALASAASGLFFSFWCRTTTRALLATLGTLFMAGGAYYVLCPCLVIPITWASDSDAGTLIMMGIFAPLVPFLASYPSVVGVYGASPTSELRFPLAYLLGNASYLALAATAVTFCIQRFDSLCGRTLSAGPTGLELSAWPGSDPADRARL